MNCDKCAARLLVAVQQAADNAAYAKAALRKASIDALDGGVQADAVAEATGVNRATIYRWRREQ